MKKINEVSFIALGFGFALARLVDANYVEMVGGVVVGFIGFIAWKMIKNR